MSALFKLTIEFVDTVPSSQIDAERLKSIKGYWPLQNATGCFDYGYIDAFSSKASVLFCVSHDFSSNAVTDGLEFIESWVDLYDLTIKVQYASDRNQSCLFEDALAESKFYYMGGLSSLLRYYHVSSLIDASPLVRYSNSDTKLHIDVLKKEFVEKAQRILLAELMVALRAKKYPQSSRKLAANYIFVRLLHAFYRPGALGAHRAQQHFYSQV